VNDDNIFEQLLELLQSPGPVNWKLGAQVGQSLAGKPEPIEPALLEEYAELIHAAELHVAGSDTLSLRGDPITLTDRRGWADANFRSFAYLAEPLAAKMGGDSGDADPGLSIESMLSPLAPVLVGMQIGSMVGLMAHRVLGQFDVGLPPLDGGPALVVPNIEAFAVDYDIDARQARLWAALHEVIYQAQLAVPWARHHFISLVDTFFEGFQFDPSELTSRMESLDSPEELAHMMENPGGLASLLSGPPQTAALEPIQAFLAFLEGHADYLMDRIAGALLTDAPRIRESINRRRAEPTQGEQVLQELAGLAPDRLGYQRGEAFCREVAERWGDEALAKLWKQADNLPSAAELEDPIGWAARVLVDEIGSAE
jgi:putative hydrolase